MRKKLIVLKSERYILSVAALLPFPFLTAVVFKLFWVAAPLEEFDSTAAHLNLLHQTNSSAFILS